MIKAIEKFGSVREKGSRNPMFWEWIIMDGWVSGNSLGLREHAETGKRLGLVGWPVLYPDFGAVIEDHRVPALMH